MRAHGGGSTGFTHCSQRVNVAITRARRGLIILGHWNTLTWDRTGIWSRLLREMCGDTNGYMEWGHLQHDKRYAEGEVVHVEAPKGPDRSLRWQEVSREDPVARGITRRSGPDSGGIARCDHLQLAHEVLKLMTLPGTAAVLRDAASRTRHSYKEHQEGVDIKRISSAGCTTRGRISLDANNRRMRTLWECLVTSATFVKSHESSGPRVRTATAIRTLVEKFSSLDLSSSNENAKGDMIETLLGALRPWNGEDTSN